MSRIGVSVHVGVNCPDAARRRDLVPLRGCENDARALQAVAARQGFDTTLLLGTRATYRGLVRALVAAARRIGPDGILLVTYAGHGGRVPHPASVYGGVGSWCLHDRDVQGDELYRLWGRLPAGARIVVLSDSCRSGSVAPGVPLAASARRRLAGVAASVLLISAAQAWELAVDGAEHGLFTETLLDVWADGAFHGSYRDLHAAIFRRLEGRQHPDYARAGARNPVFEQERPFTI